MNKMHVQLTAIMNGHAGGKSACGREMGNNEFPPLCLGKADHSSLADFDCEI